MNYRRRVGSRLAAIASGSLGLEMGWLAIDTTTGTSRLMPLHDSRDGFYARNFHVRRREECQVPHVQGTFTKKFRVLSESYDGWLKVRVSYWSTVDPSCQLIPIEECGDGTWSSVRDWFWLFEENDRA